MSYSFKLDLDDQYQEGFKEYLGRSLDILDKGVATSHEEKELIDLDVAVSHKGRRELADLVNSHKGVLFFENGRLDVFYQGRHVGKYEMVCAKEKLKYGVEMILNKFGYKQGFVPALVTQEIIHKNGTILQTKSLDMRLPESHRISKF